MAARALIVGGLLALLAGVLVAGSATAHRQLSSNYVDPRGFVAVVEPGERLCQDQERVPDGTSALRFTVGTYGRPGPRLELRVSGGGPAREGALRPGWREGSVVVPLAGAGRERVDADVCLRNAGETRIALAGQPYGADIGARVDGAAVPARVRIEYTTASERSFLSLLPTMADRMADVRLAFPGAAALWVWLALLGAVVAGVALILALRLPRAGYLVTGVALANALAWSLLIPPFQVPDEHAHYYYASYVAQTGKVPVRNTDLFWFSQKMNDVLTTMRFPQVIGRGDNRLAWAERDRALIEAQEASDADEVGRGDAANATTNSPVYYLLQAGAYELSPASTITGRLAWMRLLAVAISALTVALVFAFLRELLPGRPWSVVAGGLAAALQPMFGFISSGVNNDGLLYLVSALLLYGLARAFRRGLTPGSAALIGGALAGGALVKTQLLAYAPAVALAFVLLLRRGRAERRPLGWRTPAAGAAAIVLPLLAYFVAGRTVWQRPLLDRVGEVTGSGAPFEPAGLVSYAWQSFLPKLPFMTDWFDGLALKNLWVNGLVGRFGWLDYAFPAWVNALGALALALVAAGAGATLLRNPAALRRRAGELAVYVAVAAGLAAAVAYAGYVNRLVSGQVFEQARYLLPLLPLYAAAVALAVHAFGRRHARVLGCVIVLAALAHTVFAQLLTLTRYYG